MWDEGGGEFGAREGERRGECGASEREREREGGKCGARERGECRVREGVRSMYKIEPILHFITCDLRDKDCETD